MNKDSDFFDKKRTSRSEDKKKTKKFISEETQDQNKLKKVYKQKRDQIRAEELWEDWENNNEIY